MIFESTDTYISTDELSMAVDAAVKLERPLLIKGEPGTGKTLLARSIANEVNAQFQYINGPEIMGLYAGQAEESLRKMFNDAILNAARMVSTGRGFSLSDQPMVDLIGFRAADFPSLVADGSVGRIRIAKADLHPLKYVLAGGSIPGSARNVRTGITGIISVARNIAIRSPPRRRL